VLFRSQLANLYLFFALNEALVLRSTNDKGVWRTVLSCLLVADLGHLWACRELGGSANVAGEWFGYFWRVWEWNAMGWGNVGFVYLGMVMRVAFLMGVGMGSASSASSAKGKRK